MSQNTDEPSAEELLRIVLDSIPLRVFWKDVDLNFQGANRKLLDDIGFKHLDDLVGRSDYTIFKTREEADPKRKDDWDVIHSGQAKLDIEEPLAIEGKKLKWLRTNKVPMRTSTGKIIGVLGTYQEITEQVQYRQSIEKEAFFDPLTGLANRRKLQSEIKNSTCTCSGLLFIDLDHFKHINDTLGHNIGDILLQKVALRLQTIADNNHAVLARLGGDEFSIFKLFKSAESIEKRLEEIAAEILSALTVSFEVDHHIITVGASIGITSVDGNNRHVSDGFIEADIAMYSAKASGRNNYQFFNETLRAATERKHTLLNLLRKAIEQDEFKLVYQPQFDDNNKLIGAEALLRWHHEELGMVAPSEFIPIAEETGLIHSIGDWVIDSAINTLIGWQHFTHKNPDFKLSINISSKQFSNHFLPSNICQKLLANQLWPGNFTLEITESVLIDQKALNMDSIFALKNEGVSIAIDDFGIGYSSLSYLSSLPIDTLKIDQSFIRDIDQNEKNRNLAQVIVKMADQLGMQVVAEGVETMEEKSVVESLGCLQFQGFLFSKPVSHDEFNSLYIS